MLLSYFIRSGYPHSLVKAALRKAELQDRDTLIANNDPSTIKDTLWVLRRDEPLVHVSVDISLITKHILDHDTSLKS